MRSSFSVIPISFSRLCLCETWQTICHHCDSIPSGFQGRLSSFRGRFQMLQFTANSPQLVILPLVLPLTTQCVYKAVYPFSQRNGCYLSHIVRCVFVTYLGCLGKRCKIDTDLQHSFEFTIHWSVCMHNIVALFSRLVTLESWPYNNHCNIG
jgi:hypothetical protein